MEKSKKVYEIFQNISPYYDKANNRISLGLQKKWKKKLVEDIGKEISAKDKVLDICCGTGDIAIAIAEESEANVCGLDFSENMLNQARKKSKSIKNVSFAKADAKDLPYPDSVFACVSISFGLRNTDDYEKVIGEMARVARGKIYVMDSFPVENILIKPFYTLFFKYLMPLLGGGIKRYKEYTWLYESTKNFVSPKQLVKIYEKLGLENIEVRKMLFGACVIIKGQKSQHTGEIYE